MCFIVDWSGFFPSEGGKLKLLLNSSHFEIRILNISNRQQDMW